MEKSVGFHRSDRACLTHKEKYIQSAKLLTGNLSLLKKSKHFCIACFSRWFFLLYIFKPSQHVLYVEKSAEHIFKLWYSFTVYCQNSICPGQQPSIPWVQKEIRRYRTNLQDRREYKYLFLFVFQKEYHNYVCK